MFALREPMSVHEWNTRLDESKHELVPGMHWWYGYAAG